ncbi:hypothetical protein ABZ543_17925 [Streptomyces roseifaciens]
MPWLDKQPTGFAEALATVGGLHRAGVPVLAGTDVNDGLPGSLPVVHGASLHQELVHLVAAGLSPRRPSGERPPPGAHRIHRHRPQRGHRH